jgi:uncharacterized membrane protein
MLVNWGRRILALLVGALVATLLVSLGHSLMVQGALRALGVEIPPGLSLATMGRDFVGLLPTLGGILLGALLIALAVAGLLRPRAGALLSRLAYPLAGLVAVALALFAMRLAFGFSPLAGARTPEGFALMSAGGLVAGWVFARMLPRKAATR